MREFREATEEIKDKFEEQIQAEEFKRHPKGHQQDIKKDLNEDEEGKKNLLTR